MISLATLMVVIVAVSAILALIPTWTASAADLLFMFAMRKAVVGGAALVILIVVVLVMHWLGGFEAASPTAFLTAVIATPLAAQPLADWLAFKLADEAVRRRAGAWYGFIFAERKCALDDAYEAPPTSDV